MKHYHLIAILLMLCVLPSCEKTPGTKEEPVEDEPEVFSIVGKWGMLSGETVDVDGQVSVQAELSPSMVEAYGKYYLFMEFNEDGTFEQTDVLENNRVTDGLYTYDEESSVLSYKYDGNWTYYEGKLEIKSEEYMTMTTEYETGWKKSQNFQRIIE